MTDRQAALLNYVRTLGPHMNGITSVQDFTRRLMRCIAEDGEFLAQGGLEALKQTAQKVAEAKAKEYIGSVSGMIDGWFEELGKKHRNKK